jgi:hypothetical protein
LNPSNEPFLDEDPEGVVYGLTRNCANFRADHFCHVVGRHVGLARHGLNYRHALGGDLDTVLAQNIRRSREHHGRLNQKIE